MSRVHNDAVERRERAAAMTELRIGVVDAIGAVAAAEWDACANPISTKNSSDVLASVQAQAEAQAPAADPAKESRS